MIMRRFTFLLTLIRLGSTSRLEFARELCGGPDDGGIGALNTECEHRRECSICIWAVFFWLLSALSRREYGKGLRNSNELCSLITLTFCILCACIHRQFSFPGDSWKNFPFSERFLARSMHESLGSMKMWGGGGDKIDREETYEVKRDSSQRKRVLFARCFIPI